MRENEMRTRLMEGGTVLGIGCSLDTPLAAENLALAGFDFVLIDNQHGAWDDQTNVAAFRSVATIESRVPALSQ